MTSSDSVNLLYSTYPGKAPKYLGRRDDPFVSNMIVTTENGAPRHLSQLSNGPGESLTSYRYNYAGGWGSFVYVVDVGLLQPGKGGGDVRRSALPINPTEYSVHDQNDLYSHNVHGSLISALAVGSIIGIARRANLVSVKISEGTDSVFTTFGLAEGIVWAMNDIVKLARQQTAVITITLGKYICGL